MPATSQPNQSRLVVVQSTALSTLNSLVDNHFKCSICLDTIEGPNVIPECLHRFCDTCINKSIQRCGARCPTCRARITSRRDLRKDQLVGDIMNKVLSAIKSLECVDILQVNVKEDKEVVHSGHGSASSPGYVKKGEIETDAPKNAEDPVQDINNRSESNEEDREPPVHTGTSSERKRSAASDASTTLHKTRKKIKTRKKTSTKQPKTGFDERCNQLLRFKEEFGHCNVPRRYADNPSLAHCCSAMRQAYNKRQQGMKTNYTLSQDRIERLEEIGFQWQGVDYDKVFDERCRQLIAFKEEFGHCNVPQKYAGNPSSLGQWCNKLRHAYKKIQKGMKTGDSLSQARIERLEEIGFQWQGVDYDKASEKRCRELIAFKEKFGHCNVPSRYADNPSLGKWCGNTRSTYKKMQKGMKTDRNLRQDRIERLEEIGFQWN